MTPLLADRPAREADAPPGRDAALRRSESLLGLVWERAADGMRLTTPDGTVVMANPAYCRMVGRPPSEVVGRCFADAYSHASRDDVLAKHRGRFSDPGDRPLETQVELADGRRACFEFSHAPLDLPGRPPLLLTITRDVTARNAAEAEAGAWRARYEAAVRATGQVLYDWDVATGRLTWGGSCAATLGYTPEELPADFGGWAALVHPDDWPAVGAEVDRVVATGEAFRLEYRLRRKDGSHVVVEDRGQFVHGAAGGLRTVGFLADVTARAAAERAVQEREELLRSVLAHIPDGVFWKDRDSVYLGCNDRVARDAGLASPAELVGTTDLDTVVAPAEAAHYRACDRRVMEAGEPLIGIEETRTMPDGRVLALLTSKVPLRDAAGAVVGVLGVYRDVTERNRAEEALRRSQALFRAFMDNTPAVAFIKDADGRYVYANRRWEEQFDPPRRDWAGKTDAEFWPPEAAAAFRASDRAALEPGWRGSVDEVVPAGAGAKHFLALKFPVEDEAGRRAVGGVVLDVTEKARLEEQLRQAQKMEAVGRLAGGVAHDFNNLLTVINGFSDMALDALPAGDPARDMVREVRDAGTRAADLTRQLLAYGRKQILRTQAVDLGALAADMGGLLGRLLGEDVELVLDPRPARVEADPGQLSQVVMNLAVNARDAMPRGGRLAVRTRAASLAAGVAQDGAEVRAGAYALLEVSDTGTGVPKDVRRHLFEPFYTTKGQGQGTGLGLATVYGIVKQSGGHVEVETGSGRGTTFRVYLPAAAPGPPTADRPPPAPAAWAETARAVAGGRESVLLVEDDDGVRALAVQCLQAAGYLVVDAANGGRALATVAAHGIDFDLVVTDVVMPGMGGRELADRLTAARPGLKVLFMSGYTDDAILRHGVEQDAVHFLPKPFAPADLARKVREVLNAGR